MQAGTSLLVIAATATLAAGCGASHRAKVPDVTRLPLDVAENRLDAVDLRYETIGGGAFGIVVRSHWRVCSQRPRAGAVARKVTLVVARACGLDVVPDVEDMTLEDAHDELVADGFAVRAESLDGDPILVEHLWTVCSQSPAPGRRGRTVVLQVAHDCENS